MLAEPAARLAADDHRLDPREVPLERIRKQPVERLADEKPQDGIAEKLEPLVGGQAVLGPGGVGQGGHQQGGVTKHVSDPALALCHVNAGLGWSPMLLSRHVNTVSPFNCKIGRSPSICQRDAPA